MHYYVSLRQHRAEGFLCLKISHSILLFFFFHTYVQEKTEQESSKDSAAVSKYCAA